MILENQLSSAFKRGKEREYERLINQARYYRNCVKLFNEYGHDYINRQLAVIKAKVYLGQAKRLRHTYGLNCWIL
jgi:hypothetical protein